MTGLKSQLPDGYELESENPDSVCFGSDKTHVIVRYAVKPIDNPHAELKQQYALDVETCASIDGLEPWQLWQVYYNEEWNNTLSKEPRWEAEHYYRRHPHADNMIVYHQCNDADKNRWQIECGYGWHTLDADNPPEWVEDCQYRLKTRTISVTLQNGNVIEFPEPVREPLNDGDKYYVMIDEIEQFQWGYIYSDTEWLNQGRIYLSETDCQAAHDALQAILSQRSE